MEIVCIMKKSFLQVRFTHQQYILEAKLTEGNRNGSLGHCTHSEKMLRYQGILLRRKVIYSLMNEFKGYLGSVH